MLAAIRPRPSAWLPVMFRYVPGGSFAGATSYETTKSSEVSPYAQPALNALTFASAITGFEANLRSMKATVFSVGRW